MIPEEPSVRDLDRQARALGYLNIRSHFVIPASGLLLPGRSVDVPASHQKVLDVLLTGVKADQPNESQLAAAETLAERYQAELVWDTPE
jgi:hypothetical protein